MKNKLKIFIVSPNDVKIERKAVVEVCHNINNQLRKRVIIEPVIWENHTMDFYKNPQENINSELKDSDIYIIILWNKIGSVIEGAKGEITNEIDVTGTQYEIEYILKHKKESIYFYFKDLEAKVKIDDALFLKEQKDKLNSFLKKIGFSKNSTKYSYQEFKTIKEFKEKIYSLIRKELKNRFNIEIEQSFETTYNIGHIKNEPHPNYYVGLYVFMTVILIWIFLYMLNSKEISQDARLLYDFSLVSYLALLTIPIKNLPTDPTIIYNSTFKDIVFSLLRIGLFIIVAAFAMGFTIWYFLLPQIKQLLGYIFM